MVVGGGPAAVSAVATLRHEGYDGRIALVSEDRERPYERPPLSKEFLRSEQPVPLLRPADWYAEQAVDLLTGTRAERLDLAARRVELGDGTELGYDALLLATGVRARSAVELRDERLLHLRTTADARQLRDRLTPGSRVVVLGGGFIGCEVAATAVGMDLRVTLLERSGALMQRAFGAELGRVMTDVHRAEGVESRLGTVVLSCRAHAGSIAVRTDRGTLEADLVVVGAGCTPNVELATEAGLETANGIRTDALCRTSATDVYAAGDVASSYHPYYGAHLRVEHHDTALRQGAAAARAMLGGEEPFTEPHWFWSDQYDNNIQQVGRSEPGDELVIRGSLDELSFTAMWLRNGRITKAIAVNRPREAFAVRKALFTEHEVHAEELADPDMDLRRLTRPKRLA